MNVKQMREDKKLTQEQLATLADIPRDRIAKWEQGKGSPKADDYRKLMEVFGEEVPGEHSSSSLAELVISNKVLADANKTLAEANLIISRNNQELIELTKHALQSSWSKPKEAAESEEAAMGGTASAVEELRQTGSTGPFSLPKASGPKSKQHKGGK
jgi:transcriptional regulator with XRE-family HTH domain